MPFEITCGCGKIIPVTEGMAGSSIACQCGRAVSVPSLSQMRSQVALVADPADASRERSSGEKVALWALGILVIGTLLFCGVPISFTLGGFAGFGYLVALTGHFWLLGLIIRECHPNAILMALVIPFFTCYFAIQRWDVARWPLIIYLIGLGITIAGLFAGV
jgi:hypothetical protein